MPNSTSQDASTAVARSTENVQRNGGGSGNGGNGNGNRNGNEEHQQTKTLWDSLWFLDLSVERGGGGGGSGS